MAETLIDEAASISREFFDQVCAGIRPFTVTRQWLHDHSTPGGGWTAKQLAVFDISWPPSKGWLIGMCGKQITVDQKARFETLHSERQEHRRVTRLKVVGG